MLFVVQWVGVAGLKGNADWLFGADVDALIQTRKGRAPTRKAREGLANGSSVLDCW